MSIREYKKGEHKSSFIGLRVVVLVGKDYRQKYFNFRKAANPAEKAMMRKEAEALNAEWDKDRLIATPPREPKPKIKRDPQKFIYGIYNQKGKSVTSYPFIRQVAAHLDVTEKTVSKSIKNNSLVVNHKIIQQKKGRSLPNEIAPFKTRNRIRINGTVTTAYRVYDLSGKIIQKKLFTMPELTKLTSRDASTIHEAAKKYYPVAVKYLVSCYTGKPNQVSYFDLSPLSQFFKVFVFNKQGKLIHWYVKPTIASVSLGVNYGIIYDCMKTGVSRHPEYFFTNHLPKSSYKNGITTKFKVSKKPKLVKAHSKGKTISGSLSKVCKLLNLSYSKAKQRLDEDNGRSIFKGVLLEYVETQKTELPLFPS